MSACSYSLEQLAQYIDAELLGDKQHIIEGLASLTDAKHNQVSFLSQDSYLQYLQNTQAGAVILPHSAREKWSGNRLIVTDSYFAYAQLSHLFNPVPKPQPSIHPSAIIAEDVYIDSSVYIGPQVVIDSGCHIGQGVYIGAGSVIGQRVQIGHNSHLAANVTLYYDVILKERVQIHSGTVIGSDGFGFAKQGEQWYKIAQLGTVIIGDDVEIGANTTIDRGALDNTLIANGVKIDNLVQIAHNVEIGENTAIAGCVGIAGSSKIGRNCSIGGGAGLAGHLTLADQVHISGMSLVSKSLTRAGVYASGSGGCLPRQRWRKQVAYLRQLEVFSQRLKKIEQWLPDDTEDFI